jgi:hypothetical protein
MKHTKSDALEVPLVLYQMKFPNTTWRVIAPEGERRR